MECPKIMKAAILHELGKPLVVDEVKLPENLELGQVLVKVEYSGICGSQIGEIDGKKGKDRYLPHLLGHEGSGIVIQTGSGVTSVKSGDNVIMHWRKGKGIEAQPPQYLWKGNPLNAGFVTTFNEYAIVSENRVTAFNNEIPMDIAPLMGCAVTTGLGVITNNARVRIGESVVVLGAGGVGLNVIQGAAMSSAYPIVAVDKYENRLKMATTFGATHIINGTDCQDLMAAILKVVGKEGVDVIIDNTGSPQIINQAYQVVKNDGKIVLVGVPQKGDNISIYSLDLHFGKTITGSHGGEAEPEKDIPRYLNLYNNGKLELNNLITNRYRLDDINLALNDMKFGVASGRCLIEMTDPI